MTDFEQSLVSVIFIALCLAVYGFLAMKAVRFITRDRYPALLTAATLLVVSVPMAIVMVTYVGSLVRSPGPEKPSPSAKTSTARYMPAGFVIDRHSPLLEAYGGFAAILLTSSGPRGTALCRSFLLRLELKGFRPQETIDGTVIFIRPVYWFTRRYEPGLEEKPGGLPDVICAKLLADYDFGRAQLLMERLSLNGPGPFLVAADLPIGRSKGTRFATWDLREVPADEIAESFNNFLEGYRDGVRSELVAKATMRQRIKTIILTYSLDLSFLFGVKDPAEASG